MRFRKCRDLMPPRPVRFGKTVEENEWRIRGIACGPDIQFDAGGERKAMVSRRHKAGLVRFIFAARKSLSRVCQPGPSALK
jgi:hypothetical protein